MSGIEYTSQSTGDTMKMVMFIRPGIKRAREIASQLAHDDNRIVLSVERGDYPDVFIVNTRTVLNAITRAIELHKISELVTAEEALTTIEEIVAAFEASA